MPTKTHLAASAALLGLLLGGCTLTAQVSPTAPAGITQQLLIRSLERALAGLDLARLDGRSVTAEVFVHAGNEGFVREFVTTWLKAHGVRMAPGAPDLKLKVFASVFGTDRDQTLIGVPTFPAPIVNVAVPEIALFKWERNRGQSELRVYALDPKTDALVETLPPGLGRAKYDNYTLLLFIGFTWTDVEKRE